MAYRAPERKGKTTVVFVHFPDIVQECQESSSHSWFHQGTALMTSRGESIEHAPSTTHAQPALQGSSHCPEQNRERKCPGQLGPTAFTLWSPAPSTTGRSYNSYLTQLVISRTSQCPTQGLKTTGPKGVHPRAEGAQPHSLWPSPLVAKLFSSPVLETSPQAQVLSPRGKSKEYQRAEITSHLRQVISSCITPETHIHYSTMSSRSQEKSSSLA